MNKWQSTIRWISVAIVLLAAGPVSALADASAAEGYRVALSDLDLQSASGVNALYGRLQTAARAVCGLDQARGYARRRQADRCVSATLDAVVAEVAAKNTVPGLFAAHRAGRNGPTIRESRLVAEYRLP
jgi:UrcA family protein